MADEAAMALFVWRRGDWHYESADADEDEEAIGRRV